MSRRFPAVLVPPVRVPWWCRTFGHAYTTRPTVLSPVRNWYQPPVPTRTYCRRCGHALPGARRD